MSKLIFIISFLALILLSANCTDFDQSKNQDVEFIIYSKTTDSYNNLYATVYASDSNWTEIVSFADSLVQGHGYSSSISFYSDSNRVPIIGKYYGYVSNSDSKSSTFKLMLNFMDSSET